MLLHKGVDVSIDAKCNVKIRYRIGARCAMLKPSSVNKRIKHVVIKKPAIMRLRGSAKSVIA